MRDNMLKIPGIPSNPDEGDLYEKIETRPGTTEKQKEAGRGQAAADDDDADAAAGDAARSALQEVPRQLAARHSAHSRGALTYGPVQQ